MKRTLYMKFRVGIAPLRIETGRYEANGSNKCGINVNDRICLGCMLAVENEKHFLIECPLYEAERKRLIDVCTEYNQYVLKEKVRNPRVKLEGININNMDTFFVDILKCTDREIINAVAQYIWDSFKRRTLDFDRQRIC